MKKVLAFVLAMVMVMGMVVVSNAAAAVTVVDTDIDGYVLSVEVECNAEVTTQLEVGSVLLKDVENGSDIAATLLNNNWFKFDLTTAVAADHTEFLIYANYNGEWHQIGEYTYEAPAAPNAVQAAIVAAFRDAYDRHNTTAIVYTADLIDETIYEEDWLWMQGYGTDWAILEIDGDINEKAYVDWVEGVDDDYYRWAFINMNLIVVDSANIFKSADDDTDFVGNGAYAEYRISADAISAFTAADVDFDLRLSVPTYDDLLGKDYTVSEVYAKIRELTGDTKNPYVFGWDSEDATPEMKVSVVIDSNWIDVYGHKDLTLFVFDMASDEAKCEVCGADMAAMVYGASNDTTVTANTQTKRIVFDTNKLYKTLVLSACALAEEGTAQAGAEDANPNTGANDMVNVAVVFSVVALVAAAAFVASKQH